uniref:3'(2'),5'-bisphosphate nucleotidase n=1 Tax=Glycine max TaxID=3847 RepID=K7M1Q6_SOYBN
MRAILPFPQQNAKHYKELEAAVDVVRRACRLCLNVKSSLFSTDEKVLEKNDQTPVTVADFGVQALISLELNKLFPSIPLVAEEDSAFLLSRNLADTVLNEVTDTLSSTCKPLTQDDVLEAIDRGGKDAFVFGSKPATYWVLNPIDGPHGFLKAGKALYVVGLALVVEGEIVVGVMGCPNWEEDLSEKSSTEIEEGWDSLGTWMKSLNSQLKSPCVWTRCFVDGSDIIHKASFCIPDSQTWESLPLYSLSNAPSNAGNVWDHAVGIICVHEAGGKVTDWQGSDIDLAVGHVGRRIIFPYGGVLVTNSNLHDKILQIIDQTSRV